MTTSARRPTPGAITDRRNYEEDVELRRRTWFAALQLAAVISVLAVLLVLAVSALGDVPQAAVVLPVIVVAFVASWIRTERVRRDFARPVSLAPRAGAPVG